MTLPSLFILDATFLVYFDGVLQNDLTRELKGEMIPELFVIPVSGVGQLKLQMKESRSGPKYGFGNITIK